MTLNGKEILAVEVPDDMSDVYIKAAIRPFYNDSWTILGRSSEISEEVARGLVSYIIMHYEEYYNYQNGYYHLETATESLLSWCKANGITDKHILLIKK